MIVLLDEISWMGSEDVDFLGELKNAWDLQWKNNPEFILILCGSISTWIEKNILSSTGFMGRISQTIALKELSLNECNEFFKATGNKISAHEKLKLLAITGGVPRYLEEIEPNIFADENIKTLCFTPGGVLVREFEDIFHDLFLNKSQFYKLIVLALSQRSMTYQDLCETLNLTVSGTWNIYIQEMIEAGFISKDANWNIKSGEKSRLYKLRLSDNYLRFYLRTIEPNLEKIQKGFFSNLPLQTFPGWDAIMGLQFENLVLYNRTALFEILKIYAHELVAEGPCPSGKAA